MLRLETLRAILAVAEARDPQILQLDVNIVFFLQGDLFEDIYMDQPEGFTLPRHQSEVCRVQNSIYG